MKVLVTGGAGFIGSQLAYRLFTLGHSVVLLDNFSYGSTDNLQFADVDFSERVHRIDIRNNESLLALFEQERFDYVYHIAGMAPLPDCQAHPGDAISVNVTGTVNVLECSRVTGVKNVFFASTSAIYENTSQFPTPEHDNSRPILLYPNTKLAAELFCQSYVNTYGMNVCCFRFANVYGPHIDCLRKQPPFVGYMIRELFYDRIPVFYSDGNQRRDYVYVDDLIDLILLCVRSRGFEVMNVSSGQNYSVRELYSLTAALMRKTIIPQFAESAKFWSKYPELYGLEYPIKESVLVHEVNKCTCCDKRYAEYKYGWTPRISIDEGLRRVIDHEVRLLAARDTASQVKC